MAAKISTGWTGSATPTLAVNKTSVFLGFAFSEQMRRWKETVSNELRSQNIAVQTAEFRELRGDETAQQLSDTVKEHVRNCVAAVHFLERAPGLPVLDDRNRGIVQIQCDAVATVKGLENNRLLEFFWTGPDLKLAEVPEGNYKKFLEEVSRKEPHMTETVARFVNSLLTRLKEPSIRPSPPPRGRASPTRGTPG